MNQPRRRRPTRSGGFTLIEVLVALAIVAITLGAGIKAAGALANNAERLTDVSLGQWCADNHLIGLKLARTTPPIGDSDFSCEQFGRTYFGKLVVRPTPNPNFRRVDVQISTDNRLPVFSVSTVMPTRW
ncbi:type II secretion system minor pseudopilin GspI [Piscinibacter sp.]|uniref:type II secretion system minor pseudopilin GspI n=1 Tax=Piscinibacter sp. TaxID=1903157 RepID=UPI002C314039|nr:type II secretion system minor pseudopilin GspI [Albitalea sp.]HUG26426.1 type II secretion system minor pseudopilin GspI [Albitalea sp.]